MIISKLKNFSLKKFILIGSLVPMLSINADTNTEIVEQNAELSFEREYRDQLENFVFLIKYITMPEESAIHSTASGIIISSTKSHIFILTANHFCQSEDNIIFQTEIGVYSGDKLRLGQIIHIDEKNDLCLMSGRKYKDEKFKNLKIAKKMPPIGEFVFNVAAPIGMGSPNTRLVFDGHFGGCEDVCVYTIPATFGSSGSAVFNEKGELISVLVMATPDFENVGIGPDIYNIRKFISEIEKMMDIK